jgi:DUF438 domain-containing protein
MEEHKIMAKMAKDLIVLANKILKVNDIRYVAEDIHELEHLIADFADSDKHFLREENVLFPMLEKHGIVEPPAVMWIEHDEIRELKKKLQSLIAGVDKAGFVEFKNDFWDTAKTLGNLLPSHFYKENNILFPAALSVMTPQEWVEVRKEFDAIGYCCFTPAELILLPQERIDQAHVPTPTGIVQFENGNLTKEQLDGLLNALPVEVTFIDENDTVRYFNRPEKVIFVRSKAVIGRKVQNCHPAKSLDTVNAIVASFKSGKKNVGEFWINMASRVVHIRFFAVRDPQGKYLGAMEAVQDVTDIQKLQGEKRLLDWQQ